MVVARQVAVVDGCTGEACSIQWMFGGEKKRKDVDKMDERGKGRMRNSALPYVDWKALGIG